MHSALQQRYATLRDDQLRALATTEFDQLTPEAQLLVEEELRRRNLTRTAPAAEPAETFAPIPPMREKIERHGGELAWRYLVMGLSFVFGMLGFLAGASVATSVLVSPVAGLVAACIWGGIAAGGWAGFRAARRRGRLRRDTWLVAPVVAFVGAALIGGWVGAVIR